ncbi:MAG: hypothetical protein V3S82_10770 [Dehalococcoidia bacterium]
MKNIIFYSIASTITATIAAALGAGFGLTLFLALLLPPVLILAYKIWQYRSRFH